MKKYKHIYFDLDRTLWDFEANARETFKEMLANYDLKAKIPSYEQFFEVYTVHNERLWNAFRNGNLKKAVLRDKRFILTLEDFGIKNPFLAKEMSEAYLKIMPTKNKLYPNAHEILEYLMEHKYHLYILTNGFKEVQHLKLDYSDLAKYFLRVITSDSIGVQKPDPEIFAYALNSANARKDESLMIGDDLETDIIGARNYGIDQVYFNPCMTAHSEKITFEINSLLEIKDILK
jgi:putative hydrolase of the HAD superfamily